MFVPKVKVGLFFCVIFLFIYGCGHLPQREVLYQVSIMQALSAGDYDGQVTLGQLKARGDFGLGTFQGLDGELVALNGKFYQIKVDGSVDLPDAQIRVPFAQVTFFDADQTWNIEQELNYAQFKQYLDQRLPAKNIFYAIKISGRFKYIKTRSVPKQVKPYPKLEQAVGEQKVFEFNQIVGTVVGWRSPIYIQGFSVGGDHLHFISQDGLAGGHLLDFVISGASVQVDQTPDYYIALPQHSDFIGLESGSDKERMVEVSE